MGRIKLSPCTPGMQAYSEPPSTSGRVYYRLLCEVSGAAEGLLSTCLPSG